MPLIDNTPEALDMALIVIPVLIALVATAMLIITLKRDSPKEH